MSDTIGGRSLLRSAKDLGRVLALARLATREETEQWPNEWAHALRKSFPRDYRQLARRAGAGLRRLLDDADALEEARQAVDHGLLAGFQTTMGELRAVGLQLLADAITPLERRFSRSR